MSSKKTDISFTAATSFDYQLLIVAASLALMSSILVGADFTNPSQVLALLISNIFAFAIIFLGVNLLQRALRRRRVQVLSIAFAITLGAIVGVSKGALTGLGMFLSGVETDLTYSIFSRTWQTLFIGILLIPAAMLLSNLRAQFNQDRQALLSEKVRRESSDSYYAESLHKLVLAAKERLRVAETLRAKEDLAAQIKTIIVEDLRPLSYEIWNRESERTPGFGFRSLISEAIIRDVYRPLLIPLLWFVTTVVPNILFFDVSIGFLITVVKAIALSALLFLAYSFPVKRITWAWAKFLVVVLAAMFIHQYLNLIVANYPAFPIQLLGIPISNMIWIAELMLLYGMMRVFLARGKGLRSMLEGVIGAESSFDLWRKQMLLKDRQLAEFLHGHLQSQLMAVSIRMEQQSGMQTLPEDIELVEKVIDDSVRRFLTPQPRTLKNLSDELSKSWGGLIELELNLQDQNLTPSLVGTISEICEEAITNSVRHGLAQRIQIDLAVEGKRVYLQITDDGTGPRDGKKGLGSYFFESVARVWRLEPGETGAVLRLELDF